MMLSIQTNSSKVFHLNTTSADPADILIPGHWLAAAQKTLRNGLTSLFAVTDPADTDHLIVFQASFPGEA
jgi:hypothetical protein